ncbi:MAG: 16S rRNA (guanine(966)-N(2))-methyltransferase RsmD [Rhodospirillaceae bacterium]|nr:16S rRNA (guanine(966)-N(2))-methyltransferase RsmD [Rhodospirillaceae bacterium]
MRIVAGKHKGRSLEAPSGRTTRPTSDRARETVFNILAHGINGIADIDGASLNDAAVVDVFAGTGALGLEAISRGAKYCVFIETNRAAIATLKNNISTLGETSACEIISISAEKAPPPPDGPIDIAFIDAPYGKGLTILALERLVLKGWFRAGTIVVIEIGRDEEFNPPSGFEILKEKATGAAKTVFIKFT